MKNKNCHICKLPCLESDNCILDRVSEVKIQTLKNMVKSLENSKNLLYETKRFLGLCKEHKVKHQLNKVKELGIKINKMEDVLFSFMLKKLRPCQKEFSDIFDVFSKVNGLKSEIESIKNSLKEA